MCESRNDGKNGRWPADGTTVSPSEWASDIDLSRYVFQTLRRDSDFILSRGTREDGLAPLLLLAPASERPTTRIVARLRRAYAIRTELDSASVARPFALVDRGGLPALLIEDLGGDLLASLLGRPMEVPQFLRIAIGVAVALRRFHGRGLIHRNIHPTNILVNLANGDIRLIGTFSASDLPTQRQAPELAEVLAGALPYLAPEQTGRMNRSVDSRSDLYAYGVTLYEMLTGVLPFTANDPMEWVHCHIARQPMSPGERVKGLPEPILAMVMKLLCKTPEERYQTAGGVEADLRNCLAAWESVGRIDPFPLGADDVPDRFLIPERLYGREQEIEGLLAAFDRVVTDGNPRLVLVSGYSGVGKSSVVNELNKYLVPSRALFASGKFDQYKREVPYATLAQAFRALIHQILGKSDAEVSLWQDALRAAVGPNGQIISSLIPELELVLGKQPSVVDLSAQDAQNRFKLVFRRFIAVFARPEHPLVLFLDDLQWLDAATLELLEHLVVEPGVRNLLLIGAYRDNEMSPSHPLMRTLQEIRKVGTAVQEIVLAPLSMDDIGQLAVDSFHCEVNQADSLARLIREKTGGNPFFTTQFLTTLAEEGLVAFDPDAGRWTWDLERIRGKGLTENVVDFIAGKLNRLSEQTQEALRQLACLGDRAKAAALSVVRGDSEQAIDGVLSEAVRAGLVHRLDGGYAFAHDRVQEAAYAAIPENERAEEHLWIGRRLAEQNPPWKIKETIFDVVSQFNRGSMAIISPEERVRVAEYNLVAGRRAKASAAYASALSYLAAGEAFLKADCWKRQYSLAFALAINRAECEFLAGELTIAEERLSRLSGLAANQVDSAAVTCLRVALYTTMDQCGRAVEVCLEYLRHIGVEWTPHPTKEVIETEFERIWQQLGIRLIEELVDLPLMTDPVHRGTLDVLTAVMPSAWFTDKNLHDLFIARMVNLSLEYGNSDGSCYAYAVLGAILGSHLGDLQAGFRFCRLGLDLVEKRGLDRFKARVYVCFGHHILPWTRPLRDGRVWNRRGFDAAKESGDLTFAAFSSSNMIANLLAGGDPLDLVQREAEETLDFSRGIRFGLVTDKITGQLGLIRTLRGLTPKFGSFNDAEFDESQFEQHLEDEPHLAMAAFRYWIRKLQARFFAGDCQAAIAAASKAHLLLKRSQSFFEVAEYPFYSALAHAEVLASSSADEKARHLATLVSHHQQMEVWAANCPENFGGCVALVAAEIARIEARDLDAELLYERAIRLSHEQGFVQHEATAFEVAARFYLARGLKTIARAYLRNARHLFICWGALGKAKQLEERYPGLTAELGSPTGNAPGSPLEQVDILALAKASQAVSSELDLNKMIETLLIIALKNAGAQRGVLILLRGDQPQIEAEAITTRDGVAVQFRRAFPTPGELPDSILRYVIRTQESILLDDASAPNQFSVDPYLQRKQARSVLCLPLVKQADLKGALYLENNLASHVFTPDRISVLKLLVSQASISLDHARLYADLMQENNDRRNAEAALRASEERLQDIIDNTSAVIFVKDLELRYLLVNREYERRYHVQREEIRGRTDFDIHRHDVAEAARANDRRVIEVGEPIHFEEAVPSEDGEHSYVAAKFLLRDRTGKPYAVCGIATDITELKRAEEMQASIIRERETLAQQRASQLAKANEALRGCLDTLASVPKLDEFLGQVMAAITRQLGAISSTLGVVDPDKNALIMELLFQNGRVLSPAEALYPESLRFLSLDETNALPCLREPISVWRILDPDSPIFEPQRAYLLELGVKTLLIIALTTRGKPNGRLLSVSPKSVIFIQRSSKSPEPWQLKPVSPFISPDWLNPRGSRPF